jgi:type 1 glutamine amidotransferase
LLVEAHRIAETQNAISAGQRTLHRARSSGRPLLAVRTATRQRGRGCGRHAVVYGFRMRASSSWAALGVLVLGCSQSAGEPAASRLPSLMQGPATAGALDLMPGVPGAGGAEGGSSGSPSAGSAPAGAGVAGAEGLGAQQPALPPEPDLEPAPGAPATSGGDSPAPQGIDEPPPARLENVLVFTRTTGFRHDSIEAGVDALRRLGVDSGFSVERTEDPADFSDDNLARFDVVCWLNTDSDVLGEAEQGAFERYIRAGGGWVGVHAAAASEYGWPWYGQLLGAYFLGHPAIQPARVEVESPDHPSTAHLPPSFVAQDEWYSFRTNPRSTVQVLLTLDESSYGVGDLAMGDHPIAWYHEFDGGRAWYTALGHPIDVYADPLFTRHLLGGLRWAAGLVP